MTAPLLSLDALTRTFGGLRAVSEVSFDVARGEILGIIGPNGAGKTSLFNLISGVLRPTSGRIVFDGEDITRERPSRFAARGIGRTFQNLAL
ncbi:MAG TPA: ATP-binding cassette domain-containing protein, partial [Beijerinckiaceae bacterium]|nr:ATP-binding cassette domain-containing protein [Beijerinckiaceae bacterium]